MIGKKIVCTIYLGFSIVKLIDLLKVMFLGFLCFEGCYYFAKNLCLPSRP